MSEVNLDLACDDSSNNSSSVVSKDVVDVYIC